MNATRFWARVRKTDGCWIWLGQKDKRSGYGLVDLRSGDKKTGRIERAHRLAWTLTHGPIPEGLCVLHACDNRICVRPDPEHLHLGTYEDNNREMKERGRAAKEWAKPNTRISDEDANAIFHSREPGVVLARRFGISTQQVCNIRKGRSRQGSTEAK